MAEARITGSLLVTTQDSFILKPNSDEPIVIGIDDISNFVYGTITSTKESNDVVLRMVGDGGEVFQEVTTYTGGLYIFQDMDPTKSYSIKYVDADPNVPPTTIIDGVKAETVVQEITPQKIKTINEVIAGKLIPFESRMYLKDIKILLLKSGTDIQVDTTLTDNEGNFVFHDNVEFGVDYEIYFSDVGAYFRKHATDDFSTVVREPIISGPDKFVEMTIAEAVYTVTASVSQPVVLTFQLFDGAAELVGEYQTTPNGEIELNNLNRGEYTIVFGDDRRWNITPTTYTFIIDGTGNIELGEIATVEDSNKKHTIQGVITETDTGLAGEGYLVILSDGTSNSYKTISDSTGWTLTDVAGGVNYILTASKLGRTVSNSTTYDYERFLISRDVTDCNFISDPTPAPILLGTAAYDASVKSNNAYLGGNPIAPLTDFYLINEFMVEIYNANDGSLLETVNMTNETWTSTVSFGVTSFDVKLVTTDEFVVTSTNPVRVSANLGETKVIDFIFQASKGNDLTINITPTTVTEGLWVSVNKDNGVVDTLVVDANGQVIFENVEISVDYVFQVLDPAQNFGVIATKNYKLDNFDDLVSIDIDTPLVDVAAKGNYLIVTLIDYVVQQQSVKLFNDGTLIATKDYIDGLEFTNLPLSDDYSIRFQYTVSGIEGIQTHEESFILFEGRNDYIDERQDDEQPVLIGDDNIKGNYLVLILNGFNFSDDVVLYENGAYFDRKDYVDENGIEFINLSVVNTYVVKFSHTVLGIGDVQEFEETVAVSEGYNIMTFDNPLTGELTLQYKIPMETYINIDHLFMANHPVGISYTLLKGTEVVSNKREIFPVDMDTYDFSQGQVTIANMVTALETVDANTQYTMSYALLLYGGGTSPIGSQTFNTNDTSVIEFGKQEDFGAGTYMFSRKLEMEFDGSFAEVVLFAMSTATLKSNDVSVWTFNITQNEILDPSYGVTNQDFFGKMIGDQVLPLACYIHNDVNSLEFKFPGDYSGYNMAITYQINGGHIQDVGVDALNNGFKILKPPFYENGQQDDKISFGIKWL